MNLNQKVTDFLKKHTGEKFTAREIAEWLFSNYPKECAAKRSRSTATIVPIINDDGLIRQLAAEIGSQRPHIQKRTPGIKTTEGRPRKYYYTEQSDETEAEATEQLELSNKDIPLEHELYPMLSEYLKGEFELQTKRIDEKRSQNNRGAKGNEWLFPDVVGMENLAAEWARPVIGLAEQYRAEKVRLWSFEVKRLINLSNVRSAFFQAVSNSSWANLGYLVAAELEERAKKELRMLAGLHGIGFILLNTENPSESQIIIPAREANLNWASINRVASINSDFSDYIENIKDLYLTGKTKASDWD